MSQRAFEQQASFWKRESPTLIGDYISRPAIIELAKGLGDFKGLRILESGCGQGLLARMLVQEGAEKVIAIDKSQKMLRQAETLTKNDRIEYFLADMTRIPLPAESFDVIFSHSVLLYSTQGETSSFFVESARLLKRYGRLIVGLPHPYLFDPNSPARDSKPNWIVLSLKTEYDGYTIPNEFEMQYYNQEGKRFTDFVYCHTLNELFNSAQQLQLSLKQLREITLPKEIALKSPYWGNKSGYPSYMHLVFTK